ncbi:TPA: phage tail protein, partial [Salmonella enterica]|nr:phage tail protein [Salmonella enterica]
GVPKWKRKVMYWAVRMFGRGMYKNGRDYCN